MQEIHREIADEFNLEIKSIMPFKDVYILNTSKGRKLLKKSSFAPERILFIHGAKEHLYNRGFGNTDRYLCTADGSPYIILDDGIFTVSEAMEGRECNFDNKHDIATASHLLASMHRASKGYVPPERSSTRDELGKLPSYFSRRLDEIKKLVKMAKRSRNTFDCLFLEYADYFHNLGENAYGLLMSSKYDMLVENTKKEGIFCHHDFTHHNIICSEGNASLVNFDFCCFELKVYDIANFLRRKMRKCNWEIDEAKVILNEYQAIEAIDNDEMFIMKIILQFPQKFWRVANKYYNSRHGLSDKSYILKLQEVIDEIPYHKKFIDSFDHLL